jgi:methionine sulfoxide reductase heme-binding subunit
MHVDPGPHLFWITSRAAGIVALAAASVSVSLGLSMSLRLRWLRRMDLRVLHETLSLSALVAIGVHGAALLGDGFLHPSLLDISVPFVSGYKTLWTSMGIVSGWGLAVLGLSYYARRRIGPARWRSLHRFTAFAWVLGLAHSLGEGTDAGTVWFLVMTGIVALPALALLLARMGLETTKGPALRDPPPLVGPRTAQSGAAPSSRGEPAPHDLASAGPPHRSLMPLKRRPGSQVPEL